MPFVVPAVRLPAEPPVHPAGPMQSILFHKYLYVYIMYLRSILQGAGFQEAMFPISPCIRFQYFPYFHVDDRLGSTTKPLSRGRRPHGRCPRWRLSLKPLPWTTRRGRDGACIGAAGYMRFLFLHIFFCCKRKRRVPQTAAAFGDRLLVRA